MGGLIDPRDRIALEALAVFANAITDEGRRGRIATRDPEELSAVLLEQFLDEAGESGEEKAEEWLRNVPEQLIEFFMNVSDPEQLATLAHLQTTMTVTLKDDFPSLSKEVVIDDPASLGKL